MTTEISVMYGSEKVKNHLFCVSVRTESPSPGQCGGRRNRKFFIQIFLYRESPLFIMIYYVVIRRRPIM